MLGTKEGNSVPQLERHIMQVASGSAGWGRVTDIGGAKIFEGPIKVVRKMFEVKFGSGTRSCYRDVQGIS